ncbi:MAG: serine/threonine protein kinase [Verrucomicrobia bacterium]|nr:serine/threonine protein kinase [Verrucomicrobiota bacterium]
MAASEEEIIVCYSCGAPMNVADVAPYSRVVCPDCKSENRVKKHFGPYTLIRRHAIGGMSSVFVAKDEALDREVALKILSEEYSNDEKRITAFEEEARLTASFSHPNVVRVLTTGRAFDRFYIAMEFVPGGHFEHQICEKGQITEMEILPLAIQVAEGLKGAQAAGLIHRDVKPGNILLDSEGNAKIVDFGLALVMKGGKAKATEIWATPYYVPPEAIEGESEDFRADIYAFGATLYHALAGKPPCDEESMATDVLREAKKKIVPLKKVAPGLSAEICAVIDRAMAYEPSRRFSSYDEMIAELQAALKIARGEAVKGSEGITKVLRSAELRAHKRKSKFLVTSVIAIGVVGIFILIVLNPSDSKLSKRGSKTLTVDSGDDANSESPREIATRYGNARSAMNKGGFDRAGKIFASLLMDKKVQEPTRTWSGLQAVVAALMDGEMDLAREYASTAEAHLSSGPAGLDSGFLIGIRPVLRKMPEHGFLGEGTMDTGDYGNERFMGYFLAALKNWESGGIEQSVPLFEIVANEPSLASDSVLDWYQEAAKNYLEDYKMLTSGAMAADPQTVKDCREAIDDLNRQLTLLNTRGRARFNIRARQLEFVKLERSLKQRPGPTSSE